MIQNSNIDRKEIKKKIWKILDDKISFEDCSRFNTIIFSDEKLLDAVDWKLELERKKEEFLERIKCAPKSSHVSIYNYEKISSYEKYDPNHFFSLTSISSHFAESGINLKISDLLDKYPYFEDANDKLYSFTFDSIKINNKKVSFYRLKHSSEKEMLDGISHPFYIDYLNEIRNKFYPEEIDTKKTEIKEDTKVNNIKWDGTKTELCELIKALYESKRIKSDNKPIQLKELIKSFENIFNEKLPNYHDLLRDANTSNKRGDGKFFMRELLNFIESDYSKVKLK